MAVPTTYYKLVNKNMKNKKFLFGEGLNVLPKYEVFTPPRNGLCEGAGLYFTSLESLPFWAVRMFKPDSFVFKVDIPEEALVYEDARMSKTWKANAIVLSEPMSALDFIDLHIKAGNYDAMSIVRLGLDGLKFVKAQTPEICRAAVSLNPTAIKYVREQSPELCFMAVRAYGMALEYVRAVDCQQYEEICLAAVQKNGEALRHVAINCLRYEEICFAAVRQSGMGLQYVQNKTPEICLAAVEENGFALRCVNADDPAIAPHYYKICLVAVSRNGCALKDVAGGSFDHQQCYELCLAAVAQDGRALEYVKMIMFIGGQQYEEICLVAIQQNCMAIEYAEYKTDAMWEEAAKANPEGVSNYLRG